MRSIPRLKRTIVVSAVLVFGAWLGPLTSGCSSSDDTTGASAAGTSGTAGTAGSGGTGGAGGTSSFCQGGFVRTIDGAQTCEGLCDPSKCNNPGNVCVNNLCALPCTTLVDCPSGQTCVPAKNDAPGNSAVSVCRVSGKANLGLACPLGTECDTQLSCPDGSFCDATQCAGTKCTIDPIACAGLDHCSAGTCESDGSACVVPGCDAADCKPLSCLSSALGDSAAYCTLRDCTADTDCGDGFWCVERRDPHQICGATATDPNFCGTTTDPCVDLSMNTANGTTYTAGSVCTERKECRKRRQCTSCTTDNDCAWTPGTTCVGGSCAFACTSDENCQNGYTCTSGSCTPRGGACHGGGNFCDVCRDETDCAAGSICASVNGTTIGLRACLPAKTCNSDADCPVAPSGAHGSCAGTCYFPVDSFTNNSRCYCGNKGESCGANADCCSNHCVGADSTTGTPGVCQ